MKNCRCSQHVDWNTDCAWSQRFSALFQLLPTDSDELQLIVLELAVLTSSRLTVAFLIVHIKSLWCTAPQSCIATSV